MKTRILLATLVAGVQVVARAGTLFTNPVIYVSPMTLEFVAAKSTATVTNSFLVENMGRGILNGKATVPAPFKIISGQEYSLGPKEAQLVTVIYTPSGDNEATVRFTGGSGTTAKVKGTLAKTPAKKPDR